MAEKWRLPKGKTWRGKLEEKHLNHGKVVAVPPKMRKQYGTGRMLIPKPLDVEAVMHGVRRPVDGVWPGRLLTCPTWLFHLQDDVGVVGVVQSVEAGLGIGVVLVGDAQLELPDIAVGQRQGQGRV